MSNANPKSDRRNFQNDVLASPLPVLVDYWPSGAALQDDRAMLDESAASYAGRLNVAKLNIDENLKTPSEYHVRGIPTLMRSRTASRSRPRWCGQQSQLTVSSRTTCSAPVRY